MKPSATVPIAILIGGLIVAGAVYLSVSSRKSSTASGSGNPAMVRGVGADDHILGNPAAPVMIVEYADFDCTFCKDFDETLRQLIASKGAKGSVARVFREFPLTELHPNALKHAEAAECAAIAGGNDAFWRYAALLFAHQSADPLTYGALAASAGVPGDAFAKCMANAPSRVDARIAADRTNALSAGARGTPYSLILAPGRSPVVVDGAYSYDALKALVDDALKSVQ